MKDLQQIINKIEARKNVTNKYFENLQRILDWITSLEIDVKIMSNNVIARYEYIYNDNSRKNMDSAGDDCLRIAIVNRKCRLYHDFESMHNREFYKMQESDYVNIKDIEYLNIKQCNEAIFSILTQIKNLSDRKKHLDELIKINNIID